MKVLLDENLPHDLRHLLPGHGVVTVAFMEWSGVENGELLARAATDGFDVVISMDAGIEHQHNPQTVPVAVVLLVAVSNAMDALEPLVPALLRALETLQPRSIVRVGE